MGKKRGIFVFVTIATDKPPALDDNLAAAMRTLNLIYFTAMPTFTGFLLGGLNPERLPRLCGFPFLFFGTFKTLPRK